MEVKQTICGGCAQSDCGIDVHLDGGKIKFIEGTKGHPYSHGNLCPKGIAAGEMITDPNRLQYPMKRAGERGEDKWKRISWDEALDTIAKKLLEIKERYGPEQVAFSRGTGPGWEGSLFFHQLFLFAFGSGNLFCQGHVCKFPRVVVTGTMMGGEPDLDIEHTNCILLWGSNPAETSLPNYWSRITKAKKRGVKLIVVDPRFSRSATKADLYVPIRPGTDGALALGLAHLIIKEGLYDKEFVENYSHGFDEYAALVKDFTPERVEQITQVPQETVREIALSYGGTKPSLLFVGNGVEQLTNSMQTMRAIYCLPGLTGNIGVKGGHILHPPPPLPDLVQRGRFFGELLEKSATRHKFFYSKVGGGAAIGIDDLYETIRTGEPYPIRALLCTGSSFLTIHPGAEQYKELFRKNLELMVVHDPFMTKEARELADIVLPATTFLECWRFRFMRPGFKGGAYTKWLALQRPVVEPVGESWPDEKFAMELARRVGLGEYFPWKDVIEFTDELLKPIGLSAEQLVKDPKGFVGKLPEEDAIGFYKKNGFNTPTKKFEFYNTSFEKAGFDPLPRYTEPEVSPVSQPKLAEEYPLILDIGIKPGLFCHTQYHTTPVLHALAPDPWVEIHPLTADKLGIADGDSVRIVSPNGKVNLKARISGATVSPNLVYMPYGWAEYEINTLSVHGTADPICGSAPNHALMCRIEKA